MLKAEEKARLTRRLARRTESLVAELSDLWETVPPEEQQELRVGLTLLEDRVANFRREHTARRAMLPR